MDLSTGKGIRERFEALRAARINFDTMWQDIDDTMLGMREFNAPNTIQGRRRTQTIYDTTSMVAGHFLAGTLHGMMTNPSARWFYPDVDDRTILDDSDAKAWMDILDQKAQMVFRRADYGFLPAIAESYVDDAFFGNSDVFVEDVPGFGPRFYTRPLTEIFVDESSTGKIDTFYRFYKLTIRQAMQEFEDRLPGKVLERAQKNPNEPLEFLHLVHPAADMPGRQRDPRPWRSVHVIMEGEQILREGGYWSKPHQFARWAKNPAETYGRGPASHALSDAKMLNEMSKTMIQVAQKQADPPLMVLDDGVLTQINTTPGSINVRRLLGGNQRPVEPLFERYGDTILSRELIEQRQAMVERHFLAHLIDRFDKKYMTATETIERETHVAQMLVSTLGRLENEKIEPLLARTFDVMERGGMLPRRPASLRGVVVRPRFLSPVERVQRQGEKRALLSTWAAAAQLAPVHPEVFDNLDPDFTMRAIAEADGVPPGAVVAIDDRDETRDIRAEAEQQQAAQEALVQGAEVGAKLIPALAKAQEAQAA